MTALRRIAILLIAVVLVAMLLGVTEHARWNTPAARFMRIQPGMTAEEAFDFMGLSAAAVSDVQTSVNSYGHATFVQTFENGSTITVHLGKGEAGVTVIEREVVGEPHVPSIWQRMLKLFDI
jgi:hypothetical protein